MNQPLSLRPAKIKRGLLLQFAGAIIFLLLVVLLMYTFTHESGHALAGLLFGGAVSAFDVNFFTLSAHVNLEGQFSTLQHCVISAAGVSLPLLLTLLFFILAPKGGDLILGWFKLMLFMVAVNPLLAWIVIPFLLMNGAVISDDVVNFIAYSQLPPALVSGAALLAYLGCWAIFLPRMGGFPAISAIFRPPSYETALAGSRRTVLALAAVGAAFLAVTAVVTLALPDRTLDAPPGYNLVADIDLTRGGLTGESVYQFTLDQPASASFFFALDHVKGAPTRIELLGPDGYSETFFSVDDPSFNAGQASVHPQNLPLPPGNYQIRLTFQQSFGSVMVYLRVN